MPKIHEARGVTDARQPQDDPEIDSQDEQDSDETEEGELESAGNNSSESDEKPTTKSSSTSEPLQQPAPSTGSRSRKGRRDS